MKTHKPVPIHEKPTLCNEHPNEQVRYWCENNSKNEECQILICRECVLFEHKDHKFAPIDKVANKISEQVSRPVYLH